jgi:hypothetical protein
MEQNSYSNPSQNLNCNYRFTCAAAECAKTRDFTEMPACHVERFKQYQPVWHQRDWEDIKKITWVEVFSFKEIWVYLLYIVIIGAFLDMVLVFMKFLLFF